MKKIFLALLFIFLTLPGTALAADIKAAGNSGNIVIEKNENIRNLYTAGGNIDIRTDIKGDLVLAGGNINIEGGVERSLLATGGTINIRKEIGQNARIIAGNTVLDGKVGEDLVVLGGTLTISKDAVVKGDLLIAAGQVTIDGKIEGNIMSPGTGEVTLNGSVGKDANLGSIDKLSIGNDASIAGKLSYSSPQEGSISNLAKIGSIDFKKTSKDISLYGVPFSTVLYNALLSFTGIFVALMLALYFIPKTTASFVKKSLSKPLSSFWWGIASLVILPILIILLLVSIMGAKIGFMALLAYPILLIAAQTLSCLLIGALLLKKGKVYPVNWKSALLGAIVASILSIIPIVPVIGWTVILIFFFIAAGQLLQMLVEKVNLQRE